jgi:hypothetical protein
MICAPPCSLSSRRGKPAKGDSSPPSGLQDTDSTRRIGIGNAVACRRERGTGNAQQCRDSGAVAVMPVLETLRTGTETMHITVRFLLEGRPLGRRVAGALPSNRRQQHEKGYKSSVCRPSRFPFVQAFRECPL